MRNKFKNGIGNDSVKKVRSKSKLLQQFDEAKDRLQYKCVQWLECKTAHWSRKRWILILVLFTLLTSGYNIYVIVGGFMQSTNDSVNIGSISKPATGVAIDAGKDNVKVTVSEAEYEKSVRLHCYTDSLGRSPTGKKAKRR
jgi:hypothetical protein